jgi:hypothetical protein
MQTIFQNKLTIYKANLLSFVQKYIKTHCYVDLSRRLWLKCHPKMVAWERLIALKKNGVGRKPQVFFRPYVWLMVIGWAEGWAIFRFIAIFSIAIIVSKVETWVTIYRNYRYARWLSWYCFACVYNFYKILKKLFQFLENIVFKRIKPISWIKYELII